MLRRLSYTGLVLYACLAGSGCKADPPPPPEAKPSKTKASKKVDSVAKVTPHGMQRMTKKGKLERLKPSTMKRYRVQACFFGAQGLKVARDAYLKSLAGGEPGPKNIPSMGDYPEHRQLAERFKSSGRKALLVGRGLPFARHLRSCDVAKRVDKGKDPALDKALSAFDEYVSGTLKTLREAHRYYVRKEYEKDEFRQGRALHVQLDKAFTALDGKVARLSAAVTPWLAALGPITEPLDAGGKLAEQGVGVARRFSLDALEANPDVGALKKQLEALAVLQASLAAREKEHTSEPHPRVVMPRLTGFSKSASAFVDHLERNGPGVASDVYPVMAAMALLVEANHRGHAHLLRRMAGAGPVRILKPPIVKVGPGSLATPPAKPSSSARGLPMHRGH